MNESAWEYEHRVLSRENRWEHQEKFCLLVDLTKYAPEFHAGVIGIEGRSSSSGVWARGSDRFFPFELQSGRCLDVLWKSVKRVEP